MYGFLTHVVSFKDTSLEKLYAYGKWLRRLLPSTRDVSILDLGEDIDLAAYPHPVRRLRRTSSSARVGS